MGSIFRILVLLWAGVFSMVSMWMLMIYLTQDWNMSFTRAAAIVNIWKGLEKIAPIPFVYLAETYLGNYTTLLISSISSSLGWGFLALSTLRVFSGIKGKCGESLQSGGCVGRTQKILFYLSLPLLLVGVSGIGTSQAPFLQEQFKGEKQAQRISRVSREGCLFTVIILGVGLIVIQYVESWPIRLGTSAICTVIATLMFLTGTSYHRYKPTGSPLFSIFRKESRFFVRLIPIWMTFVICGAVNSIGTTFFEEQAVHMDLHLGKMKLPITVFLALYQLARAEYAIIYHNVRVALNKHRPFGYKEKHGPSIGIAMGMVCAILCCITAAKVENRRLNLAREHGLIDKPEEIVPMSVFWLLPQYVLLAGLDKFFDSAIEDLYEDQFPASMKNYLIFFTNAVPGPGIMASVLLVYLTGKVNESLGKPSWFQKNINESRLDNFYWLLAALSAVNLVVFALVAMWYPYRERAEEEEALQNQAGESVDDEPNFEYYCCLSS